MARAKSAVLSEADKKAVITDVKTRLKEAKAAVKTHSAELNTMVRAHNNKVKSVDKDIAALTKTATKLEAELAALQPSKK